MEPADICTCYQSLAFVVDLLSCQKHRKNITHNLSITTASSAQVCKIFLSEYLYSCLDFFYSTHEGASFYREVSHFLFIHGSMFVFLLSDVKSFPFPSRSNISQNLSTFFHHFAPTPSDELLPVPLTSFFSLLLVSSCSFFSYCLTSSSVIPACTNIDRRFVFAKKLRLHTRSFSALGDQDSDILINRACG